MTISNKNRLIFIHEQNYWLCPIFLCFPCSTKKAACLSAKGLCSHLAFSQPNWTTSRRTVDIETWLGKGFQLREVVHS